MGHSIGPILSPTTPSQIIGLLPKSPEHPSRLVFGVGLNHGCLFVGVLIKEPYHLGGLY